MPGQRAAQILDTGVSEEAGAPLPLSGWQRAASAAILFVCLGAAFLMPSHDSLWIDEAMQWRYAAEPSLQSWMTSVVGATNSEAQMPLSMLAAWAGGHTLGTTEWRLRAINIPWCILAIVAVWKIGRRLGIIWLPLLFVAHPFLWFYVNEARPYALQIACGAWLLWGLIEFAATNGKSWRGALALAIAGWALLGASMLGGFTVAGVGAVVAWGLWRKRWRCGEGAAWVLSAGVIAMSPLMVYYVRTVLAGAGGSKVWQVGGGNLAFAIYELAGFGGLGPARGELRASARGSGLAALVAALKPYAAGITSLAAVYATAIIAGAWRWRRLKGTPAFITLCVPFLVFGALAAAAMAVKFPFWGRHLAPLLPFVVLAVALACQHALKRAGLLRWVVTCGLLATLLVSAMQLRFSQRHKRDDYRAAAAYAREALGAGERVWWSANEEAARYYKLRLERSAVSENHCLYICARKMDQLGYFNDPDLIIVSKPEVYDEYGELAYYINIHRYELIASPTSFRIYRRAI